MQAGGSALAFEPLCAWKGNDGLGASWYVDPNATGANDGTSWTSAWTAWDGVNWSSISPGDTIYISGGIGSQTYRATTGIEILASGTATKPITVKRGVDTGHNGEPIFDGSGSSVSVVGIKCSQSYVIIDGIAARNYGAACFYLDGATDCVVQNCMGEVGTAPGNNGSVTSSAAFTAYQAVNCTFRNNTGLCSQVLDVDTDTFSSSECTNLLVENNHFTVQNNSTGVNAHCDGAQSYHDVSLTIRNNVIDMMAGGPNNHGVIVQDIATGGTLAIYNNLILCGNAPPGTQPAVGIFIEQTTTNSNFRGACKIWNNTIYGGYACIYSYAGGSSAIPSPWEVKNNILYATEMTVVPYYNSNLLTAANIDYNCIYAIPGGNLRAEGTLDGSLGAVRARMSLGSGLWYWEIETGYANVGGNFGIGLANANLTLTNYLGCDTNSVGYFSNGGICINGSHAFDIQTFSSGNVIAFALYWTGSIATSKLWIRNLTTNSYWNNSATDSPGSPGSGGLVLSALTGGGPLYLAACFSVAGSYLWLNPGNRSFAGTIPEGASAAGVSLTFNPAEHGGSVSLMQTFTATLYGDRWENWAAWRATGADAHSINTDPLFVAIPRNFALQRTSPARDAGLTIPSITSDILGIARPRGSGYSIGAYET